jgi:lipopolysaccharide biosynthesis glycosyltransferase
MINLVVSLKNDGSDNYLKAFSVMYVSARALTKYQMTVFILHDDTLTDSNIAQLSSVAGSGDYFEFVDVTKAEIYSYIKDFCEKSSAGIFTDAVLWRVFLPELLPNVKRLILCDADLIFLSDIHEIWKIELPENYCIASVRRRKSYGTEYLSAIKTDPGKYFRMGLSLIDLSELRRQRRFMEERVYFLQDELPRINKIEPLNEQSLFNYFFSAYCLPLDIIRTARLENIDFRKNNVLDIKGWRFDTPLALLYFFFLLKTPWRDEAIARFNQARMIFALWNRLARLLGFFKPILGKK